VTERPHCHVCGARAGVPCQGPPGGRRCPWAIDLTGGAVFVRPEEGGEWRPLGRVVSADVRPIPYGEDE
jgi:hypothetical protein